MPVPSVSRNSGKTLVGYLIFSLLLVLLVLGHSVAIWPCPLKNLPDVDTAPHSCTRSLVTLRRRRTRCTLLRHRTLH